ncbi:MAG: molybdopterin-guanine dinucleotide biosynthesis protein B [Dehalococcoidia bacterium]
MKRLVAFSGPSGAGKTTLIERLIPIWVAKGRRVGVVKHDPHGHASLDTPGKDSWRFREAGAAAVQVLGPETTTTVSRSGGEDLDRATSPELRACDLLIVEGFKSGPLTRIEVVGEGDSPLLALGTIAVVGPEPQPCRLPFFLRDDVEQIATFVTNFLKGLSTPVAVLAGGMSRRMGRDKATATLPSGQTLLERAIGVGREVAADVVVVSRWPELHRQIAESSGAGFLEDDSPEAHPGWGIVAALRDSGRGVIAIPCDIPGLRPEVLRRLEAEADASGADFVCFAIEGRLHPLPGCFGPGSLEPLEGIAREGRPLYDLAAEVDTVVLSQKQAASMDPTLASFQSLNTPEELAAYGQL